MKSHLIASLTLMSLSLPLAASPAFDQLAAWASEHKDAKQTKALEFAPLIQDDSESATPKEDKQTETVKHAKVSKEQKLTKESKEESSDKEEKAEKKKKSKAEKAENSEAEPSPEEKEYMEHQAKLTAMLKIVKTPFALQAQESGAGSGLSALRLSDTAPASRLSGRLSERLLASRLYMPGRLVIGKQAEFTVKGKPGYWAAIAMADRDSGAKPVMGHKVRLGPDRKVIALGQIPPGGVLSLKFWAPVEGDLIGQNLYFEAALWPDGKPESAEIATTVSSESQAEKGNAILVTAESDKKKGIRLVPDSAVPMYQRSGAGPASLDAGKL
ncbi:MAG: hypothetical protein IPP57_01350 [Candidatus Obscuribacter sp.]|nr:hypothetical protein [Candidatus Obscuribacter sp.]